ncbi:hypothetical protein G3N55_11170 [Dissulfurirhabdus thermomarina]|uniref:Uncharacterized protein n=1 Tax=Dissulfurirhabdus thermomarina TaxID=1765737 RepID=A0A6N9TQQ7_DISTH|nr:hypothetical protein [Dissulfurirhabdus thermomarina]NDY43398.1 hypothetical protein [Dissulfurirhabdus thermomarina]NMX23642.1 hypothetical protein [Dissulfurirhabdus thermomarina]
MALEDLREAVGEVARQALPRPLGEPELEVQGPRGLVEVGEAEGDVEGPLLGAPVEGLEEGVVAAGREERGDEGLVEDGRGVFRGGDGALDGRTSLMGIGVFSPKKINEGGGMGKG